MLIGLHGYAKLDATLYALAEALMRRPGVLVADKVLIAAMHRSVTRAPGEAAPVLCKQVQLLRGAILVLARERVQLQTERGVGRVVKARW